MIFWKRFVAHRRKKEGFKETREEKEAAEAEREDTVWMVVRVILSSWLKRVTFGAVSAIVPYRPLIQVCCTQSQSSTEVMVSEPPSRVSQMSTTSDKLLRG